MKILENKKNLRKVFFRVIFPIAIVLIVLVLFLTNYKANTWLMGWDNLMDEFNIGLNLQRHIFGVWQEFQGVGLQAGISFAADLPRVIITGIFSLVMPLNMVRYAYMFLCLLIGSLGSYSLIKWLLRKGVTTSKFNLTDNYIRAFAFIGTLFYVFNQGTLQTFYAPIETFPTQWAYMPILFLFFFKSIYENKKKNYFFFALASFLAAPMAQVPTTYIVYAIAIAVAGFVILISSIPKRNFLKILRSLITLAAITLTVNAFWLFPFISFYLSPNGSNVSTATINQAFSEDIYNRNVARGTAQDVMLLRGYLYDTYDQNIQTNQFEPMMKTWVDYYTSTHADVIGFIFFIFIIIGIIYCLKKRSPLFIVFVVLFLLSIFLMGSSNAPFGFIFDKLRELSPAFKEAFRFPYTKSDQLATLVYSVLFTFGALAVYRFFSRFLKINTVEILIISTVLGCIVYCFPMFTGNLLYNQIKVQIPPNYFSMFDWFKNQPKDLRIANLPQSTFMNWSFYKWGYRGSGFLWYGIEQPILDRAFDSWSDKNQQYYKEINNAIYNLDTKELESIAKNYNIGWFMFDKNVVVNGEFVDGAEASFYKDKLLPAILSDSNFKVAQTFGSDLTIIEYTPNIIKPSYIRTSNIQNVIGDETLSNVKDTALANSEYLTALNPNEDYLTRDINKIQDNIKKDGDTLSYTLSDIKGLDKVNIPDYFNNEELLPVEVSLKNKTGNIASLEFKSIVPQIYSDNKLVYPQKDFVLNINVTVSDYSLITLASNFDLNLINQKTGYITTIYINRAEKIKLGNQSILTDMLIPTGSTLPVNGNSLTIKFTSNPLNNIFYHSAKLSEESNNVTKNCFTNTINNAEVKTDKSYSKENGLIFNSQNADICTDLLSFINSSPSNYILSVTGKNINGYPLEIQVQDKDANHIYDDFLLKSEQQFRIINKKTALEKGEMNIRVDNLSRGYIPSINTVSDLNLSFYPIDFLNNIKLTNGKVTANTNDKLVIINSSHILPFLYTANVSGTGNLILNQGYSAGWQAIGINTTNTLFNGWANSWKVNTNNQTQSITIIFIPQLLELIGFLLLILCFITLLII